mmetsp:Transcript_9354/g.25018  ORF Transcript_9354/g.25018 Transcript_9354/m.25018 type:complete len:264 (-) Transcript_9354:116-907(-)
MTTVAAGRRTSGMSCWSRGPPLACGAASPPARRGAAATPGPATASPSRPSRPGARPRHGTSLALYRPRALTSSAARGRKVPTQGDRGPGRGPPPPLRPGRDLRSTAESGGQPQQPAAAAAAAAASRQLSLRTPRCSSRRGPRRAASGRAAAPAPRRPRTELRRHPRAKRLEDYCGSRICHARSGPKRPLSSWAPRSSSAWCFSTCTPQSSTRSWSSPALRGRPSAGWVWRARQPEWMRSATWRRMRCLAARYMAVRPASPATR